MDPISVTASIIAVLQLTSTVIQYLDDIKDAPKDRARLVMETSNLYSLLMNLKYRLEEGRSNEPWYNAIKSLAVQKGPLDQYKDLLEALQRNALVTSGLGKIGHALVWKFNKSEVENMLSSIDRLKLLIQISLEMDHFKLSRAIHNDNKEIRAEIRAIQQGQDRQQNHAIADWISSTDFPAQQSDVIARREEGTGQWFLDSPIFSSWLRGPKSTLFCPGIPGAGKSTLAAITIDHISKTEVSNSVELAYIYCNYKSHKDIDALSLLSALLKQLVQSRSIINEPVSHLYEQHASRRTKPSLQEVYTALQSMLKGFSTLYIVVDALDECSNQDGARNQLLDKLRDLQREMDLRLMVTSRFIPDIENNFRLIPTLEIRASAADIRQFVRGQIHRLPKCIRNDNDLQSLVEDGIAEAVDGMFLLARLYVDSLLDKRNKGKVESALARLKRHGHGSDLLRKAYDDAISRIEAQLPEDASLAKIVLSWISYAQRLLTTTELCHALAVHECRDKSGEVDLTKESSGNGVNEDYITDTEDIISVCAGLVTIDEESNIIRLVHFTTQEYFEQIRDEWNPLAQEMITSICLTYLSFNSFMSGSCSNNHKFKRRLEQYPFLDYATRYWGCHAKEVQENLSDLAAIFLRNSNLLSCAVQVMSMSGFQYGNYSQRFPKETTWLHLTARFGLLHLSAVALSPANAGMESLANQKDSYGQTPLSWAAEKGHEAVVKLLIERDDVETDSKNNDGRTPLWYAAAGGHEAVVKLLIERDDVETDSKDNDDRTPLSWAATRGHEAVVKLLIKLNDVEANSKDNDGQTPLSWAAAGGHDAVVKLLNSKIDHTDTANSLAIPFIPQRRYH